MVATALGCLPSAIDDEPAINVFELLAYWAEEPPAHVTLALRYLQSNRRHGPTEEEAKRDLGALAEFLGPPRPLPSHLKEMVRNAEDLQAKLRKTRGRGDMARRRH